MLAAAQMPLLATFSGVLAWAAFPPATPGWGAVLGLVALTPLFVAVRTAGVGQSLALGLLAGTTMTGLGFWFLVPAAAQHGGVSPVVATLGYAALTLYHGLFVALPLGLAARLRSRVPVTVMAPVLLALAEVALPAPLPWSFGAVLVDVGFLAPAAGVFGAPCLSLLAFGTAAAVADLLAERGATRAARPAVTGALTAAAIVATASMTWSSFLTRDLDRAPTLRVGALHAAAGEATSLRRPSVVGARAASLAERGARIVVAPETALPGTWSAASLSEAVAPAVGPVGAALVTGAVVRDGEHAYNSAIALDAEGRFSGRYDKRDLLLLAETGAFSPGEGPLALSLAGTDVGVTICLEDTLTRASSPAVRPTPGLLVNLTNDSWFAGSSEPASHFALARLRAVESGRFLVRSTAGGFSAVIDPSGARVAMLGPTDEGDLLADVALARAETPFARLGLIPFLVLCAAVMGAAASVSRASSAPS